MPCCPPNYLGLTQLGRPINLILRHAAPQGANAGFVIASHSSGLSRTAATLVTIASAASATAPAPLGRPINLVLRHAAPQISRPTGSMLFLPSPCSNMPQSPRTGSEVTPLNSSNHFCCRTCSHYSPGLFSGLREGRPPSDHQFCQNRGRCWPSGSSSNVNGLPYWGVVLNVIADQLLILGF